MAVRGPAAVRYFSKYPFLPGAEDTLSLLGAPSLRDLVTSPLYSDAREIGRRSIEQAARDPTSSPSPSESATDSAATTFLAFQFARMVLRMPQVPLALERRWCLHVAKEAWSHIAAIDTTTTEGERAKLEEILFISHRLGLAATSMEEKEVAFSIPAYVHLASSIREETYRLAAQQRIKGGMVIVESRRAARLLQEGIRLHLLRMPRLNLQPALIELLLEREGDFVRVVAASTPVTGEVMPQNFAPGLFPPCILEMQATMARGENLSHFGRFTLAAFLHKVGASMDYMVDCYKGAPDFDEDVTRYQLEHITSHDDGNGYTPPECATVLSNGLCLKERDDTRPSLCLDPTLRHPLNYYHRKAKLRRAQDLPSGKGPVEAGRLSGDHKVEEKKIEGTDGERKKVP